MSVDPVRSFDSKSVDPAPAVRGESGGTGFSELMGSLLGGRGDDRPPARADARDGASRPDAPRADEAAPPQERASRGPGRRGGAAGRDAASSGDETGAVGVEQGATPVELAAAAAQPEWIALALGAGASGESEAGAAGVGSGGEAADGLAGGVVDALEGVAAVGSSTTGLSEQRAGTAVVDTPPDELEGRVARSVSAALEGVRSGEAEEATKANAQPTMPARSEPAATAAPAAVRMADPTPTRPAVPRNEDPRRASDASGTRAFATVVRPEATVGPVGGGDAQLSQDRPRDSQAPPAPVVEPPRAESQTSVSSSADPAATPSPTVELAGRSQELAAQARVVEGMPLAQAMRSPEPMSPMSPMQTGRPMPSSAPDSIAVQADWLATRGGGTARLVLHPPELGEIAIRVTVRNQAVDVVMVAHTALAHQVAEDQSDRLSQAFASRDLRLEQFEVRRGDPSDASSTGQFGSSDAGARERERAHEEAQVDRGGAGQGGRRRGAADIDTLVAPPRSLPDGRAAGIDLRI